MSSPEATDGARTPTARYVHTRGVRLRVHVQSPFPGPFSQSHDKPAPLVLFVHGFGGGSFEWLPLFSELADDHVTVAAVDLRGYGDSDKTPRGYDLTTAASDIAGVIRGLGYARATIVGHGYGGMVAWTLAAHEPDRVERLFTISSAHPVVQARHGLRRPLSQRFRLRTMLFMQLPRLPERTLVQDGGAWAERIFRRGVAPGFRDTARYTEFSQLRRDAILRDKVAHLALEYRRWFFRSRFRPDGFSFNRTFPRRTAAPVMAVDGGMDPAYAPAVTAASCARGARGSTTALLHGVGHYGHVEDAPAVADLLRDWLRAEHRTGTRFN